MNKMLCSRLIALCEQVFKLRWIIGVAIFAFLVAFKIHGVSLQTLNRIVQDTTPAYSYRSVGQDRGIRFDEYMVSVPLVMAQCESHENFPRVNRLINGTGMDMFIATPPSPVWDLTAIGQAANWGYFLFGFERGLAWNWWIRYLFGFLFALEFFLIWLNNDRLLAVAASLGVVLAAPTQWWTTTIPYLVVFAFASLVFLHKLFVWRGRVAQSLAGVGLLVSLSSFGFSFYPPFQILFLMIMIPLGIDMVRYVGHDYGNKRGAWYRLVFVVLLLGLLFYYCFITHQETFARVAGSVYPGARVYKGGALKNFFEFHAWQLINLFMAFRNTNYLNACELSVFFAPTVAVLMGVGTLWHSRKPTGLALPLLVGVFIVLSAWMAFSWPHGVAKPTLLYLIAPSRAAVASSLIALLLSFKIVQLNSAQGVKVPRCLTGAAVVISLGTCTVTFLLQKKLTNYFTAPPAFWGLIWLSFAVFLLVLLSISLLRTQRKLFAGIYLVIALLGGALVNPLSMGASPLRDKELAVVIKEIEEQHGTGMWACKDFKVAQFVAAHGKHVLNGTQQISNPDLWRRIDNEAKYSHAWNRFCHISLEIVLQDNVRAELTGNKTTHVNWNLSREALQKLGVKYLIWSGKKIHEPWVEYLGRSRLHFIYKIHDGPTSCPGQREKTSGIKGENQAM